MMMVGYLSATMLFACCSLALAASHAPAAVEQVVLREAAAAATSAAAAAGGGEQQEESYQRVYEAFTKLMQNTAQSSLSNVRRLVSRLNTLVGTPTADKQQQRPAEKSVEEKTEQILDRLDTLNRDTDPHTLQKLNEDVSKLIGTLNDSYLRNIRRVIERVNKVVGQPSAPTKEEEQQATVGVSKKPTNKPTSALLMDDDRLVDQDGRLPGFPGFDELIVAMDRMQKSLAHFVRSSTRLITAG